MRIVVNRLLHVNKIVTTPFLHSRLNIKTSLRHPSINNPAALNSIRLLCFDYHSSGTKRYLTTMSVGHETVLERPAQLAIQIFNEAVESVKPKNLLKEKFKLENESDIIISDGDGKVTKIDLKNYNKVYVVGKYQFIIRLIVRLRCNYMNTIF